MAIVPIGPYNSYDSNIYLVTGEHPVLIDAGSGACHDQVVNAIRYQSSRLPEIIIATHCHYDHIGGLSRLAASLGARMMIGRNDSSYLREADPNHTVSSLFGASIDPIPNIEDLSDGDVIDTGEHRLTVIETPGHTPGGICLIDQNGLLISGDTLFLHGIGRTDFVGGSFSQLSSSLHRLSKLNISGLFPGHGDMSYGYGPGDVEDIIRIMGA